LPERLTLYPNHPNPFNAQTTIEYTLPLKASVHLVIFNVAGQPVRRLVNGAQAAGHHRVVWDGKGEGGREVTSGIYYYRLKVDNEIRVRQMTILK
jgi:flagellar hook assembly protein FlgD